MTEFGEKGDKTWDRVKDLTSMTQGSQSAKDFVRNVLVKACRIYGVEAHSKLEQAQQMEVLAILMNGFNTTVKTLMLLRNVQTIPQVIECAQEAKSVEEKPSTDTFPLVKEEVQNCVMPIMADVAKDLEKVGGAAGAGVARTIAKWTKPPSSPTAETKHVSFKNATQVVNADPDRNLLMVK